MTQPVRLLQFYDFYEYDGTNSAELLDFLQTNISTGDGPWYIYDETGGSVIFAWDNGGTPQFGYAAANVGGGLLVSAGAGVQGIQAPWDNLYIPLTSIAPTGTAAPDPLIALGVSSVPSLLGSASTTVQVTISPARPDTDYAVASTLLGTASLLASLTITNTVIVSGSRVDVTVQNTGLLTLTGASVLVAAVDN